MYLYIEPLTAGRTYCDIKPKLNYTPQKLKVHLLILGVGDGLRFVPLLVPIFDSVLCHKLLRVFCEP